MARAIWNGAILAETDDYEEVEGNIYFPPSALNEAYFKPSDKTTYCGWKGEANYFTLEVNGQTNPDAAWVYREPKDAASHIKGYVAFWGGVTVEE